jgi:3-oxoacyl-[acyl-carrier-protein] synthase-3
MRFKKIAVRAVETVLPPRVVSSAEVEERLRPVYERLRLPEGRLELMSGIAERRFWEMGTRPSTAAALAGKKALEASGISPAEIGCLIHASVCRNFLEPATAAIVHKELGLPATAAIFDLSNACLGVLNAMTQVASLIETGQIKYGLIVSGETAEDLHESTIKFLNEDETINRQSIKLHFASLTIASGSAAIILGKAEEGEKNLLLKAGAILTDSSANDLCQEDTSLAQNDVTLMATDSEALLQAGIALANKTWQKLKKEMQWENSSVQHIFTHQVGSAHKRLLFETLGLDTKKDFPTVQKYGNTGSAALPTALAEGLKEKEFKNGEQIALLGIGSGLSSLMLALEWKKN